MRTETRHKGKRLLCLLLVLCIIFSIMSTSVLAEATETEQTSTEEISASETGMPEAGATQEPETVPKASTEPGKTAEELEKAAAEPKTSEESGTRQIGINPFALEDINDYFTVGISTNTSFQTFDIPSGTPVQKLPVTLKITTKLETSISGGKILLPLAPEAPNGNTYFNYDSSDSIAGNLLIDSVTEVDTDGDSVNDALEITLKDTVPANTQVSFMVYYDMDQAYKSQVMAGTVMWEATAVLQMDGATNSAAMPVVVKTSATDDRSITHGLLNPTTYTVTPNLLTCLRVQYRNNNPYKIDFAAGSVPTVRIYYPAGTTVTSSTSGWTLIDLTLEDPADDRVCYEKLMPADPSQWQYYNYQGTIGSTFY